MKNMILRTFRVAAVGALAAGAMLPLQGCSTDKLLKAEDPDLINPTNIQSPEAADALANGAIGRFSNSVAGLESTWLFGGLLADEWSSTSTFTQNDETDQRNIQISNASVTTQYRNLHRARTSANQALRALAEFRPNNKADIGEMLIGRGYAEMQLGETFCSGQPFSEVEGDLSQSFGVPLTTDEVFEKALATFDSALLVAAAGGTPTPSTAEATARTRIRNAAMVARGRVLRNLRRFPEAAAAVATVATTFRYDLTYTPANANDNVIWVQNVSVRRYTIGDSVEGNARSIRVANALPFYSARDPRVIGTYTTSPRAGGGLDTVKSQDGATYSRTLQNIYDVSERPATVFSGLDARLIEAEAALVANDFATMIGILNTLRGTASLYPPGATAGTLPQNLTDQGSRDANIDLYFREKAFWTFGRGQRLGDLRRLLRAPYARPQNQVFPTGEFFKGGTYGTDVNFPVPQAEENNPNFQTCGDRST